jgi:enoyl-CoA hydratase
MEGNGFEVLREASLPVVTIRLARPDQGNRLLTNEIRALGRAICEAGSAPDIKAVLVRASGQAFCLGRQPDTSAKAPSTAIEVREQVTQPILDLYADIRATPVPVIAVVQGEARGFGCALVGQCDLAISVPDAMFSMPEMDGHLPPTLAISAVLGKVPPKRLLQMVYTRKPIGGAEALAIGLISQLAQAQDLDAAVQETLTQIVDRNRASLCAIKEYMGSAPYLDPHSAARLASNLLAVVLSSPKDV